MQPASGSFRLIVRRGPQPNQIYELNKDIVTLGRDITNDITINDPECSRHHARLSRDVNTGGFVIEDLGSTNGTFVNGQRLTGPRLLSPGETVGMGETVTLAYEASSLAGAVSSPSPYAPPPPQQAAYAPPPQARATELGTPPPSYEAPPPPPQQAAYAPPPQAPAYPQQQAPYPQQANPYDPAYAYAPPQPYSGYEEEPSGGGMMRWVLLGCGCFIVLCVIGAVIGLIVIDQTCAWEQEPLSNILEVFGLEANQAASACN